MNLGRVGVWSQEPYFGAEDKATSLAVAAEELGFKTLWIPGFNGGHVFDRCRLALEATSSLNIATGVVNIWRHDAADVAETVRALNEQHDDRFLLGIGVSHKRLIGDDYDAAPPITKMRSYLAELDAAGLPAGQRLLGALGPKMVELSAARSVGAHPYFVPVAHTAASRKVMGERSLLMPELTVVLEEDPVKARSIAREFAALYLRMPNYTNNLRRFGYTDDDLSGVGSDRLIDDIVAWGAPQAIAARVREHLDAGADHVAVQSFGPKPEVEVWRDLAPVLRVG